MNRMNPQQILQQIMNNNQAMQNPMVRNVFDMIQRNDSEGLEEMARNLYKEKGIDIDEAIKQIKSNFGM